jgi:hypothetical protein
MLVKYLATALAVLIFATPSGAQDATAPLGKPIPAVPVAQDPASLPLDESAISQTAAPALTCALRCKNSCRGKPNLNQCATKFLANHCQPFGTRIGAKVKANCLAAMQCEKNGNKVCSNNLECIMPAQCCLDAGCNSKYRCMNHWCSAKGSPSFTLTWMGFGTYRMCASAWRSRRSLTPHRRDGCLSR